MDGPCHAEQFRAKMDHFVLFADKCCTTQGGIALLLLTFLVPWEVIGNSVLLIW